MEIMVTGRQMGKTTTALAHLYAYSDAILVVPTHQRAAQLKQKYPELADRIVSATGSAGLRGRSYDKVLVDDVDQVLYHLLGAPVDMATATADLLEVHDDEEEDVRDNNWWESAADISAETYNRILEQVDGVDISIHEQLAADVARRVADWYVSNELFPENI